MIVPVGSRVVIDAPVAGNDRIYPPGSSGLVIAAPAGTDPSAGERPDRAYRVRLADGYECNVSREDFVLLTELQREATASEGGAASLREHVIYRCIVGSRAYGLDHEASDVDTRGVYLPPADRHWSLYGVPEQLEDRENDEIYWELQKFLILALKANPNVLEVLYSPILVDASELGRELREMRARFLSRLVFQTYGGYVMSQFKRLNQRLRTGKEINWKHAMHLIRLLLAGIQVLRMGEVPVRVEEAHRGDLLAIRAGEWSLERVDSRRVELQREFEAAYAVTDLPDRPDVDAANAFLLRARRHAAGLGA